MSARKTVSQPLLLLLLAFSISLSLSACQRASQEKNATDTVRMTLETDPHPAQVGQSRVAIWLTDLSSRRISNATVTIKGDMTHPGMEPVLATTIESAPGIYVAHLDWTMSGDWIVTITATLPDGTGAEQQFDLSVTR